MPDPDTPVIVTDPPVPPVCPPALVAFVTGEMGPLVPDVDELAEMGLHSSVVTPDGDVRAAEPGELVKFPDVGFRVVAVVPGSGLALLVSNGAVGVDCRNRDEFAGPIPAGAVTGRIESAVPLAKRGVVVEELPVVRAGGAVIAKG